MLIGGLLEFSLIDYPEKISAVIFVRGCSFRCHFCHNPLLVDPKLFKDSDLISEDKIFSFLKKRKSQLEAIVVSGGEPTLQRDVVPFITKIKNLGYLVKLDTMGAYPEVIEELLQKNLLDYIAMDIKSSFANYEKVANAKVNVEKIKQSIALIISSSIDYEFRTTLVESLHSEKDILEILKAIKGAKKYILQKFIAKETLNPFYQNKKAFPDITLEKLLKLSKKFVDVSSIR